LTPSLGGSGSEARRRLERSMGGRCQRTGDKVSTLPTRTAGTGRAGSGRPCDDASLQYSLGQTQTLAIAAGRWASRSDFRAGYLCLNGPRIAHAFCGRRRDLLWSMITRLFYYNHSIQSNINQLIDQYLTGQRHYRSSTDPNEQYHQLNSDKKQHPAGCPIYHSHSK